MKITLAEYESLPDTVRRELRGTLTPDVAQAHAAWLAKQRLTRSPPARRAAESVSLRQRVFDWLDALPDDADASAPELAAACAEALGYHDRGRVGVYVSQWRKAHGVAARAHGRKRVAPEASQLARLAEAAAWLAVVPPREVWLRTDGRLSGVRSVPRYGPPRGRSVGVWGTGLDAAEFVAACADAMGEVGIALDQPLTDWLEAYRRQPEPERTRPAAVVALARTGPR